MVVLRAQNGGTTTAVQYGSNGLPITSANGQGYAINQGSAISSIGNQYYNSQVGSISPAVSPPASAPGSTLPANSTLPSSMYTPSFIPPNFLPTTVNFSDPTFLIWVGLGIAVVVLLLMVL